MFCVVILCRCEHVYEMALKEMKHLFDDGTARYTELIVIQRCKKCGKIKVKQITPKGI